MASISSVISLFILLLITYSYSAPIEKQHKTPTKNKFPPGKTIINQGVKVKRQMMSEDELPDDEGIPDDGSAGTQGIPDDGSAGTQGIPDDGSAGTQGIPDDGSAGTQGIPDDGSAGTQGIPDDGSAGTQGIPDDGSIDTGDGTQGTGEPTDTDHQNDPSHPKYPSVIFVSEKRSIEDFLLSNLESRDAFEKRAIRSDEPHKDVQTSTSALSEHQIETTTNVKPISSSADSFGKFTGLLHDKSEEQSSTTEYTTTDQTYKESTTQSTIKPKKLAKKIAVVPGIITETKISPDTSSKTSDSVRNQRNCAGNKCIMV